MTKRIASEFAIGVILMVACVIGGIFLWLKNSYDQQVEPVVVEKVLPEKTLNAADKQESPIATAEECRIRYYEGEGKIHAWLAEPVGSVDSEGIMINIEKKDGEALPIGEDIINKADANYITLKLIDAPANVKNELEDADSKNPALITIKGIGKMCEEPPLVVSIQPATIAFKKS